jgi:hypothetical protein
MLRFRHSSRVFSLLGTSVLSEAILRFNQLRNAVLGGSLLSSFSPCITYRSWPTSALGLVLG